MGCHYIRIEGILWRFPVGYLHSMMDEDDVLTYDVRDLTSDETGLQ